VSSYNSAYDQINAWQFLVLAVAAVVGLGNLWGFPFLGGQYGGLIYIAFYLIFLLLLAAPLLLVVILFGRRGHFSPITALQNLVLEQGSCWQWQLVGWFGTFASVVILSYYSVFSAEVLAYIFRAATGMFTAQTLDGINSIHRDLQGDPERLLAWHTLFITLCVIIASQGIQRGIARVVTIVAPVFIFCLLVFFLFSLFSAGFETSLQYLFVADMDKFLYVTLEDGELLLDFNGQPQLTLVGVVQALEAAFYSVALACFALMAYATHLPRKTCVVQSVFAVLAINFVVGILFAVAVLSFIFGSDMSVSNGTRLAFETLPVVLGGMQGGAFLATLFYLLLSIAALTTALALLEPAIAWLVESRNMSRVNASVWTGGVVWILGLLTIFSLAGYSLADMLPGLTDWLRPDKLATQENQAELTAFNLLDMVAAKWILPLVGFFLLVYAGWRMDPESLRQELDIRHTHILNAGFWVIRYIAPVLVFFVFLHSIQVI
ncbi:sodium-dependent transporter, partial [Kaarinaea lacus]